MGHNKLVLGHDLQLLTRRAQSLEPAFGKAIFRACQENPEILACYLLDAKKADSEETKLLIAFSVEDEPQQLEGVAAKIQAVLKGYPKIAENVFIVSSRPFLAKYSGYEFYKRNISRHGHRDI